MVKEDLFEVGIHPNFNFPLAKENSKSFDEIIFVLIEQHPYSLGVRSHSLTVNNYMLVRFKEKGLLYDSNTALYYNTLPKPFMFSNNLLRIPFNWQDDVHLDFGYDIKNCCFDVTNENVIFNFHPIHIFLNSPTIGFYKKSKIFIKMISYFLKM